MTDSVLAEKNQYHKIFHTHTLNGSESRGREQEALNSDDETSLRHLAELADSLL